MPLPPSLPPSPILKAFRETALLGWCSSHQQYVYHSHCTQPPQSLHQLRNNIDRHMYIIGRAERGPKENSRKIPKRTRPRFIPETENIFVVYTNALLLKFEARANIKRTNKICIIYGEISRENIRIN